MCVCVWKKALETRVYFIHLWRFMSLHTSPGLHWVTAPVRQQSAVGDFSLQAFPVFTKLQLQLRLSNTSSWPFFVPPLFPHEVLRFLRSFPLHHLHVPLAWYRRRDIGGKEEREREGGIIAERGEIQTSLHKNEKKTEREEAEWWGACWLSVSYQRRNPDGL